MGEVLIKFLIIHDAGLAQSVEQRTENPRVRGSIPRPGTLLSHQGNFDCPIFSFLPTAGRRGGKKLMFVSLILKGGPIMIPIILGSVIALAIILERFWTLWKIRLNISRFARKIFNDLEKGQAQKALERCAKGRHPISDVFKLGLLNRHLRRDEA